MLFAFWQFRLSFFFIVLSILFSANLIPSYHFIRLKSSVVEAFRNWITFFDN